jgi:hypothetical protein
VWNGPTMVVRPEATSWTYTPGPVAPEMPSHTTQPASGVTYICRLSHICGNSRTQSMRDAAPSTVAFRIFETLQSSTKSPFRQPLELGDVT